MATKHRERMVAAGLAPPRHDEPVKTVAPKKTAPKKAAKK